MNPTDLDALLRQTLADHKLSGSEKNALAAWVHEHVDSDPDRGAARSRVFEIARQAATDDAARRVLSWVEDALKVIVPVQGGQAAAGGEPPCVCFSPGDACLGQIVHRFAAARKSADVCVFTITDDRIARALLDAHRRGVKVRVITDNDKAFDLGSDIERIAAAGVPVRVDRTPFHMHHKYAILDETRLLNGSFNWTRGATEQNEENLVDTSDSRLVSVFRRHFEGFWDQLG